MNISFKFESTAKLYSWFCFGRNHEVTAWNINGFDMKNISFQHEHPYISAEVNNGTLQYDHDSDGTHSQVAGCTVSCAMSPFFKADLSKV